MLVAKTGRFLPMIVVALLAFAVSACVSVMRTVHPTTSRAELRSTIDSLTGEGDFRNDREVLTTIKIFSADWRGFSHEKNFDLIGTILGLRFFDLIHSTAMPPKPPARQQYRAFPKAAW